MIKNKIKPSKKASYNWEGCLGIRSTLGKITLHETSVILPISSPFIKFAIRPKNIPIGDTQAIGPSGSNHFNDQYNNIYPSASAHLHISASNPILKIEAASGTGLLSIDGNISASGTVIANNFQSDGQDQITVADAFNITGSITSSGDISASGDMIANTGSFNIIEGGVF